MKNGKNGKNVKNGLVALLLPGALGCGPGPGTGTLAPEEVRPDGVPAAEEPTTPYEDPPALAPSGVHAFSVLDMLDMLRVGDLQVSPDGTWVVFTVRRTVFEENRSQSDLYAVKVGGGEVVRLTRTGSSERSPRFTPDGDLLYLATVDGTDTLFRRSLDPDEGPRSVRTFPLPVTGLVVAPGGKSVLVAADVFPDCPAREAMACTKERLREVAERPRTGVAYDRLFMRHWDRWKDGRRSHLFLATADDAAPRDLERDLTWGLDADVPGKPFGGLEEVAFSPDGASVVYGARVAGAGEPWSTNFDLFWLDLADGARPRNLTAANPAWDTGPVFSPDGKTLAYRAMERAGFEADRFRVVLHDVDSRKSRVLTPKWDRSPDALTFTPDGTSLLATAAHLGQGALFAIDVSTGRVQTLVADGHVSSVSVAGERLVFLKNDLSAPDEVHVSRLDGGQVTALTHLNEERLRTAARGDFEAFTFKGARGDTVHAYLVKPVNFDPSQRYPVAFLIHGGPQGSFGNRFHYRWNPQAYAGAGYAAVMVDFHGSTGYGQAFTDAIRGDWGGKPLEDLQKGLKAALKRYGFLDGERVCALGASYGGYMINWIAGKWPDGFRCLVNHDGVFDLRSMYYATEELWFPEWEHGGPYHQNPKGHERHNPVTHVDRWKTPMLVIHGSLDYRVPIEQGIAAFTALVRQGVEARFVHFPDENHWILSPHNLVQWHEEVLGWLSTHTDADG